MKYIRHCYADELINNEIYFLYTETQKIIDSNEPTYNKMTNIIYILERLCFIECYYKSIGNGNSEFPHYEKDGNNLRQLSDQELQKIYSSEIDKYNDFIKELSDNSREDIKDIIKIIHRMLNLTEPTDLWHGIKITDTEYFWHSISKHNEEKCVRYVVNMIKHCYSLRMIINNNGNALVYMLLHFGNIVKNCNELLYKYFIME